MPFKFFKSKSKSGERVVISAPVAAATPSTLTSQQHITGSQTIGSMTNNNTSGSYNNNVNSNNNHSSVSGDITMSGFGIPNNMPMAAYPFGQGVSHTPTLITIPLDRNVSQVQQLLSPAVAAQILEATKAAGLPADVIQRVTAALEMPLHMSQAGGTQ